jgi:predicted metal-dependent hydrolase
MPTGRGTRKTVEAAFELEALGAPIEVRRHPTARRLTLRVSKTRRAVIVTVPVECRMDEADKFLRSNLDWVRDRLTRVPEPVPFADGSKIPLRGRLHRVSFTGPDRARSVVEIDQALSGALRLNVAGRLEHAPRRLKDWLVEQARADLEASVAVHCRSLGVKARRIALRDPTSRWGSCTADGLLAFSWRLILAPSNVLNYVAAHEVAHLREMNHGPRFWKHVASCMPRLEDAKRWLRSHGAELHRYGAAP